MASKMDKHGSVLLANRFSEKIRDMSEKVKYDDAYTIMHRNSDVFSNIFDAFFVLGCYPWDGDCDPRIIYRFPPTDSTDSSIATFCFPKGCSCHLQEIRSDADFFKYLYSDFDENPPKVFPIYFSQDNDSPFLFCAKISVSPLTFPSFAHNLTFPQLLDHINSRMIPMTDIILAVKTKFPFSSLFESFLTWVLNCENISRMKIYEEIDQFLTGRLTDLIEEANESPNSSVLTQPTHWPQCHRVSFNTALTVAGSLPVPKPSEEIMVDILPFPTLQWARPVLPKNTTELARQSLPELLTRSSPSIIYTLISSLLLEKNVIIYGKESEVVSKAVLALHFLIRPLHWVSTSISVLPDKLSELLDAPNPMIVGIVSPLKNVSEDFIYYDLISRKIQSKKELPRPPNMQDLASEIEACMEGLKNDVTGTVDGIISISNRFVRSLLTPIELCIMTNYTDPKNTCSIFMEELYLGRFPQEDREFLSQMCSTQMLRFYIEQECRKRSDRLRVDVPIKA